MNYLENRTYGRKILKGNKDEVVKRLYISWGVCILIGLVIGVLLFWGINSLVSKADEPAELVKQTEHAEPVDVAVTVEPVIATEPQVASKPKITSLGEYKLTAYCSCEKCCGNWGNDRPTDENGNPIVYTANGSVAKQGVTIAADTDVIPFDSKILIDGHEYTVQDCGGAIKGNRIDVYFESHEEALQFGVQYKEIFLKERKGEQ